MNKTVFPIAAKTPRYQIRKIKNVSLIFKLSPIILTFLLILASCAPPSIKTTSLVPGRFHEAATLKTIAVLPFEGTNGDKFSAEIEAILASINIYDKQYFSLVDRSKINKMISEMQLSQSALVDPNTAVKIGKLVGAKGIYTGVITAEKSIDSNFREERSRCVQTVTKKDRKGREYNECVKHENYTVPCTKRDATFSFTPKLIEVETGRVVYANTLTGSAGSSACSDSQKPLSSHFELIEDAKQIAKERFRKDIAPYYVTMEIKLMDSTDGISSKESKKKFKQGLDFAENKRLDRACELWNEAVIDSQSSPSILYNLGICSEISGELEQALDYYKRADRILNKPDDRITEAIERCSRALQRQKRLREQIGQ